MTDLLCLFVYPSGHISQGWNMVGSCGHIVTVTDDTVLMSRVQTSRSRVANLRNEIGKR